MGPSIRICVSIPHGPRGIEERAIPCRSRSSEPSLRNAVGRNRLSSLATPAGFEPATPRLGIWCSIQLSYGACRPETHARILAPNNSAVPQSLSRTVLLRQLGHS